VVCIVCPSIGYIVKHFFSIQSESLCHSKTTNRPESALGIDVETFSLTTTHAYWELAGYSNCMAYLGLSRSELAKKLCYGTRFDPACAYNQLITIYVLQESQPPSKASSCFEPVVICTSSDRLAWTSVAL
jgi:hypothetical protein